MKRERTLRYAFGAFLVLTTFGTRFFIRSRTPFEFDSINFAIGAFRFDLGQVTPQVPGYILHILLGRLLKQFTGDIELAYIWLGILLSIGAVLFLWRAAAVLRGERVGIIAALLWMTTPLFWFHGSVNAIYIEEAFYTSALLYLGLKWLRARQISWEVVLYATALSLATGARQTSILFFFPATVFLFIKRFPPKKLFLFALAAFALATTAWVWELFRESGGIAAYFHWAALESNFKTQSILFGNSWGSQLDTMGKVLFNFAVSLGPTWFLVVTVDLFFTRKSIQFIRERSKSARAQFIVLVALTPLVFYFLVFFMKAGYLLNVLPSAILTRAVLLDQAAIWMAERTKLWHPAGLTRPLITRNAIILTSVLVLVNVIWIFVPWPGTSQTIYDNEDTRNSFIHGAVHRYEHSQSRWLTLANRAFEYTNVTGIRAVDSLNDMTYNALVANHANDSGTVILASWWYRWGYFLLPNSNLYDLELDPYHPGGLWVGESSHWNRTSLSDSVIRFHSWHPVLLLLRHDRPDFDDVARQVHLQRLPLPEYLDVYSILDTTFELRWNDRVFICR